MFSFSFLIWLIIGWCLCHMRIPQRWVPVNPILAVIEAEVAAFRAAKIAAMVTPSTSTSPAAAPPATPPA